MRKKPQEKSETVERSSRSSRGHHLIIFSSQYSDQKEIVPVCIGMLLFIWRYVHGATLRLLRHGNHMLSPTLRFMDPTI